MKRIKLSIFCDNILECERMVNLIEKAFPELHNKKIDLEYIYSPTKIIFNDTMNIEMQLFPDYKASDRWGDKSILTLLGEYGANLTEAPDVVLTRSKKEIENILLAIEFSSAIPAGNQAWQRSGRALSFSEVKIPYLYITDIGLEELNSEREAKAIRSSNPLVPLSYIKHSQRNSSFAYMVLNPSFLLESSAATKKYIVEEEVSKIVRGLILEEDISEYKNQLAKKIANYLNSYEKKPKSISFETWISQNDLEIEKFLKSLNLPKYNKIIAKKTPIKTGMYKFIKEIVPGHALRIYNNLPMCFIPSESRAMLAKELKSKCYPKLDKKVYEWVKEEKPLIICFVNGFKPRGDDARPDRGLLPLARMLFGTEIDIMALVFGQAPAEMQDLFASNPVKLASRNGLWKSVLYYSSLTIADSANWNLDNSKLSQFKLSNNMSEKIPKEGITFPTPQKVPVKFKENDIDTAIHITFSENDSIFESLCNPPGGDWSGISFLDQKRQEHRWMSLPRVSEELKRPDHIFQITDNTKTYILIIESKEKLSGLLKDKEDLGQALIGYVTSLIEYQSSAIKTDGTWEKNLDKIFNLDIDKFFTACAFFYDKKEDIEKAIKELKVDMLIAFNLKDHQLHYVPITREGDMLLDILSSKKII